MIIFEKGEHEWIKEHLCVQQIQDSRKFLINECKIDLWETPNSNNKKSKRPHKCTMCKSKFVYKFK